MIHHCTVFRIDTGEIMSYSNFSVNDDPEAIASNYSVRLRTYGETGYGFVPVEANSETHYVVMMDETPVVAERPPIPYQIDSTTVTAGDGGYVTITGLHNPCELVIDNPDPTVETWRVTVEDGGFEFEADTPGVYTIEISRFPFLPARIEITAT